MPRLTRIEKSAFRRGEYVGYAKGVWTARHRDRPEVPSVTAPTLVALDAKLTQFAEGA